MISGLICPDLSAYLKPGFMKKIYFTCLMALLTHSHSFATDSTRIIAPDSYLKHLITDSLKKHGKVKLDLFVMSMCPFGVRAENALIPILREKGDSIEFNVFFIATGENVGDFQSLHGNKEVSEDLRQLVIARHFPDRFFAYLQDRAQNISKDDWFLSARIARLNIDSISQLVTEEQEIEAFQANISLAKNKGIFASPTLFIDGTPYRGSFSIPIKRTVEHDVCEGGFKSGKDCDVPSPVSPDCPDACVGGLRNGEDCGFFASDPLNSDCPDKCVGGLNDGMKCNNTVFDCPGVCQGAGPKNTTCTGDGGCAFCKGGDLDNHSCIPTMDNLDCPGGTCTQGTCNVGDCSDHGACSNKGACIDVGNSVCCSNAGCGTGLSMEACKMSGTDGTNNRWTASGTCEDFCKTAQSATVPSLVGIFNDATETIQISWKLEPQMDKTDFFVGRSRTGEIFNEIGYKDMSALVDSDFSFTDINPYSVAYYRISFSKSGHFTYSQVITVVAMDKGKLVLVPNPATGKVNILFNNMQLNTTSISILDLSGRTLLTRDLNRGETEINIATLPQGVYIVRAMQNGKIYTAKLEKN
jgi:glutaredoxin